MSQFSTPPDVAPASQGIPIRLQLPGGTPWAVYGLMGVTIFIYLLQVAGQFLFGQDLVTALGVKYGPYVAEGQLWRLVTPIFLHGSILHIGFNMYALYAIGPALERFWGRARFLVLYFLAGIAGNLCSLWFTPQPSLGSSTAIFGLLAAEGILVYRNGFLFQNPRRTLMNLINLAIINFVFGLSPGIDNWGHLGGFLGGAIFAWFGGPLLEIVSKDGLTAYIRDRREERTVWLVALSILVLIGALTALWLTL